MSFYIGDTSVSVAGLLCPVLPSSACSVSSSVPSPLPLAPTCNMHSRDAAMALSRDQELETPGDCPVPPWLHSQTGGEGIMRSPVVRWKASYQTHGGGRLFIKHKIKTASSQVTPPGLHFSSMLEKRQLTLSVAARHPATPKPQLCRPMCRQ